VTVSLSDPLGDLLPGVKIQRRALLGSTDKRHARRQTTTVAAGDPSAGLTLNTLGTFTLSASGDARSALLRPARLFIHLGEPQQVYLHDPAEHDRRRAASHDRDQR